MEPSPIRPAKRRPLYEEVAERLREFIDTNDLQPGDKLLNVKDLAAQLSVGHSSIREAVTALRAQGIVEVRHGEGIYLLRKPSDLISSLAAELIATHVDHPYIWETRQALETQCARLAADRVTPDLIEELGQALERMAEEIKAGEPGLEGDRRFHEGVARASRNPVLINLLGGLRESLLLTSETSLTRPGQPEKSLADHRAIFEAIRSGDADKSAHEMLRHLVGTTDDLATESLEALNRNTVT